MAWLTGLCCVLTLLCLVCGPWRCVLDLWVVVCRDVGLVGDVSCGFVSLLEFLGELADLIEFLGLALHGCDVLEVVLLTFFGFGHVP